MAIRIQSIIRSERTRSSSSLGRGLTFGDAQSLQDAIDEQGPIESLPVGVGLSTELWGIW